MVSWTGMLLEHHPARPLSSYVQKLWYCDGYHAAHRRERVLPNGRFQIVIDLRDSPAATLPLVVGMQTQYAVIDTYGIQSMMGVLFWPGGTWPFFDPPAEKFLNQTIPLESVWGPGILELRERLQEAGRPTDKFRVLETALQRRIENHRRLHDAVRYGLGEFQDAPNIRSVLDVTAEAGLSRRRFAQLFREQVGMTPKLYCRILRFQHVVRQISAGQEVDWAGVALSTGYCDQSHLAHEFRAFSGISPGAYVPHPQGWANHVPLD